MPLQLGDHALLDPFLEERHVVRPLFEHRPEDVLNQCLRQRGVVGEIRERDLGLDHPELGQMPAGVRILGAERRAEGVDLGQRQAVGLDVELTGHRQESLAAEEILREVDLAIRRAGKIHQVQRRDAKQLARAFRIRRGDDRRVDPEEAVVMEEAMDRLRDGVANARHRADDVGARPQMRDFAQEFERVRLWLDRIGVGILDPADDASPRSPASRRAGPSRATATMSPVASTAQPAVRWSISVP